MSSEISSYLMSLYLYMTLLKIFLLLLAAAYSLYYTWNAGHDFSILLYLYTYSSMYKFIYIREIQKLSQHRHISSACFFALLYGIWWILQLATQATIIRITQCIPNSFWSIFILTLIRSITCSIYVLYYIYTQKSHHVYKGLLYTPACNCIV